MKIGNLHLTWISSRQEELLRIEIREHLRDIETRQSIQRMARSEVKNYLAEIAERACIPFVNAESMLNQVLERAHLLEIEAGALEDISARIRETIGARATTGAPDDPAGDYPFSVQDGERFL